MNGIIYELHDELWGLRSHQGELTIPEFEEEDYEELYYSLLERLRPYIGSNYEGWYLRQCIGYGRHKARKSTTYDIYNPHLEIPFHLHSIRMQLTILKYFIYRQYHSGYPAKGDK